MIKPAQRKNLSLWLALIAGWFFSLSAAAAPVSTLPQAAPDLQLTSDEVSWLKAHPQVTVGISHGWSPIEFLSEGNELRGISVDYLEHLEKILGIKFIKVSSAENPQAETADMLSAVANVSMLRNSRFVPLEKSYLTMPFGIFTMPKNAQLHTLKDLHNKKVAVYKSGSVPKLLVRDHPKIKLYKADIAEEALTAMMAGKVDAYVGNKIIVSYNAHVHGFKDIQLTGETPYSTSVTMAVRDDWPEFRSILQKALGKLEKDKNTILEPWIISDNEKLDTELIYGLGIVLSLLVFALSFKSWRLSREMQQRKKVSQELIWQQANFDFLTKLPNRLRFQDRLQQELKNSDRTGLPLALLFIDLDRFKEINDSLGHAVGDSLLVEAAQRINDCVRSVDMVARLGGDEFTVVLSDLIDANSIDRVTENILSKLSEPFKLKDGLVYISASIGITLYPTDAADIDTLLKNADQAMYAAKNLGRNRYQYFTSSMQEAALSRMRITNDLRLALSDKQFRIYYQPIVELATGRILKAEALIRWQHPMQDMIDPVQFISIAEETGMINAIADGILEEVAKKVLLWRANYQPDFQISINTSPVQFQNEAFARTWVEALAHAGLPGQSISLEITEGLLLNAEDIIINQLMYFREAGVQIAIDDFGTGYSSLAYLKKFEIDYVKIDRSFIRNLAPDSNDFVLCEAIIVMAHKLGFQVIAEGIETAEQQALLKTTGCDFGQGYLFAKPIPEEEFEELLKQANGIAASAIRSKAAIGQ